jgi:hypothetical protein
MESDGRDLEIPFETGGVSWRLVCGLALAVLCVVEVVSVVVSSHPHASESTPVVLFLFAPPATALLLSGVALHRRWQPNLLFRLLPIIVCVAVGVVALWLALGLARASDPRRRAPGSKPSELEAFGANPSSLASSNVTRYYDS